MADSGQGIRRRPTWGNATDHANKPRPPPRRWRCVKATQSKLAPGNALGNPSGRRVESGETLVEISSETRSTLMGMVSQEWIEFLDPITQTMAWVPVTGLASDRRLVELPKLPSGLLGDGDSSDDMVDGIGGQAGRPDGGGSGGGVDGDGNGDDDDDLGLALAEDVGAPGAPGAACSGGGAQRESLLHIDGAAGAGGGSFGFRASSAWYKLKRVRGGGEYCEGTVPLVNTLLSAPLLTLAEEQWRVQRRRRRARRVAANIAAQAARDVARRITLNRSNTHGTSGSLFSVEEGTLEDFFLTGEDGDAEGDGEESHVHRPSNHAPLRRAGAQRNMERDGDDHHSDSDSTASVGTPRVYAGASTTGSRTAAPILRSPFPGSTRRREGGGHDNDAGEGGGEASSAGEEAGKARPDDDDDDAVPLKMPRSRQPTAEELHVVSTVADEVFAELQLRHSCRLSAPPPISLEAADAVPAAEALVDDSLGEGEGGQETMREGVEVEVLQPDGRVFCYGRVARVVGRDRSGGSGAAGGRRDEGEGEAGDGGSGNVGDAAMAAVCLQWSLADGRPATLHTPVSNLRPVQRTSPAAVALPPAGGGGGAGPRSRDVAPALPSTAGPAAEEAGAVGGSAAEAAAASLGEPRVGLEEAILGAAHEGANTAAAISAATDDPYGDIESRFSLETDEDDDGFDSDSDSGRRNRRGDGDDDDDDGDANSLLSEETSHSGDDEEDKAEEGTYTLDEEDRDESETLDDSEYSDESESEGESEETESNEFLSDPYTDGSSYTDEDEHGEPFHVHRRPDPTAIAAAQEARRHEIMRVITSADKIGTELLPGQQVMARLGVTQKQRLLQASASPAAAGGRRPAPREFAPAVVIDARRGGQYYCIRYTADVDAEDLEATSRPVTVRSSAVKFLTIKYL